VVLEDSNSGAQAGLGAGCAVVYVPSMPGLVAVPEATTVPNLHHVDLYLLRSLVAAAPT
jgi:beta-phosphoglucomutase-like phosphatase (HAD superfamily)